MHSLPLACIALLLLPTISIGSDPEVIQQFWKQLYSQLPDPALPNRLSNGQRMGVQLSVTVESAEFGHAYDDYVCRSTIRLVASWPIMDAKIVDNTLVRMAGGTVLLDSQRVWRPRVTVSGARHLDLLSRRIELQSLGKSIPPVHRALMKNPGESDFDAADDNSANQAAPGRRRGGQQPVYVMSESFNVEVLCTSPSIRHYLGAIHCPIIITQEALHQESTDFIWQDRTSCSLSQKAAEKLSYVTLANRYAEKAKSGDSNGHLSINLCFNPTGLVLRAALPGLILVLLAFVLLWSVPCGSLVVAIAQGGLLLICLATWTHFSSSNPTRFSIVDAWFLLCLVFISVAFFVTVFEQRRLDRLAKTRRLQQQRRIYSALSNASSMTKVPICGLMGVGGGGGTGGGGSGGGSGGSTCGCGGCSCAGGFCGAGSGVAGGFMGLANGQVTQMGSGSPPPPLGLIQPSPVTMPAKMDICSEAYFRSASSELSKESSNIMSMGAALRLRCAKNGGLGVFEANDSNLGLLKSQYAASPGMGGPPPPPGSLLQPLNPIPLSYCSTAAAVALPIIYVLAVIIFWGSFGAQGTVPKDCLVGSITCNTENAL